MAKKWKEYGIDVIWKNYTIMQCPGPRIWRQERLHCTMDLLWSTRQLLKKNSLFPQRTTAMWSHLSTLMHHQDPSGWVSITVFVLFRAFLVTRTISISINESPPKKMINKFSISRSWVIWKIITFFTSHSNCCRKLAPPHSRVTCKTEINLNLLNRVFASFRSFLLPPCDMILGGVTTKYHIPGYRS